MRRRILSFFFIVLIVTAGRLSLPQQSPSKRQPAPVMGTGGADWLTRSERIQEEQPDKLLAALEIKPGSIVADVGAGVGYHVWRLAGIVGPSGKVIAEDGQAEMLSKVEQNVEQH